MAGRRRTRTVIVKTERLPEETTCRNTNASGEDIIREHGRCGGFPVDAVLEVSTVINPITAEV